MVAALHSTVCTPQVREFEGQKPTAPHSVSVEVSIGIIEIVCQLNSILITEAPLMILVTQEHSSISFNESSTPAVICDQGVIDHRRKTCRALDGLVAVKH